MNPNIQPHSSSRNQWFIIRKLSLHVILPLLTGLMLIFGGGTNACYLFLYAVAICYSQFRSIMDAVFSICSEEVMIRRPIHDQIVPHFESVGVPLPRLPVVPTLSTNLIATRRIFRLRYSTWRSINVMTNVCCALGIDCPIYVPLWAIIKMTNYRDLITRRNEAVLLDHFLKKLYNYQPLKYGMILPDPDFDVSWDSDMQRTFPPYLISEGDLLLNDLKCQIFGDEIIVNEFEFDD